VSGTTASVVRYACDTLGCGGQELSADGELPSGWLSYHLPGSGNEDPRLTFCSEGHFGDWLGAFIAGVVRGGSYIEHSLSDILCLKPQPHNPALPVRDPSPLEQPAYQRRPQPVTADGTRGMRRGAL
jgi:hypothetical protein